MNNRKYEEEFFSTLYKSHVGDFEQTDLERNKKWFYGWIKFIKKSIEFEEGKVLEIGSAIGAVVSILKKDGFEVYGSDISSYAINKAKKLEPDIPYKVFDLQKKITFKEKFNYVIAFEVLEHLDSPEKGVKNIYNSLSNDGYFIFSTPPPYERFVNTPTHVSVMEEEKWIKILKASGFKKNNIFYKKVTFPPLLYRLDKRLNVPILINIDFYKLNSTIFYFAKK